jgi:exopolysaccharide biosynthesis predicted pyruvyltransferase EpsI
MTIRGESMPSLRQRLNDEIDAVLQPLLPAGTRCALLGFPHHNNVGDNAIWLGEKEILRRAGGELVYVCDISTYSRDDLHASLSDGVILLHGGGNLGDVWPVHQRFREQVIQDFPGHRIVQLPQSIHFSSLEAVAQARRVFEPHPDLTILARDHESVDLAERLGARAAVCPDFAFALEPPPTIGQTAVDVLWLARSDVEASRRMAPVAAEGVEVRDWLLPPEEQRLLRQWARVRVRSRERLNRQLRRRTPVSRGLTPVVKRSFDALARRRVRRGCELLQRGRVVITDRLHGHILSLLLGIPHVTLDNSYGKLDRFLAAFSGSCALTRRAADAEEALQLARQLVAELDAATPER